MAQPASASFGTKERETAAFASLTAADILRAPDVERKIPVDFRPLLTPHKKAGRLRLRIERLPQGVKLSAGRRSEDNSWSLASDELEDLHFLVPSTVARDHEFTVRVMTFEDDEVSTLKVVPFVIPAGEDAAEIQPGRDPNGQDPAFRNQLGEMHSLFAVRETELIELRIALQRAMDERDADLAKARSDWEQERDAQVAAAVEQARVHDRQVNEAREAESNGRAAQAELRAERVAAEWQQAKAENERKAQAERQAWQAESVRRMEAERQAWEAEIGRILKAARHAWQSESESRIEAERQKWHSQAEGDAAKEHERWKSEADRRLYAARQMWLAEADERRQSELESWKAEAERRIAAARAAWLAEAGASSSAASERSKAEVESRLDAERRNWKVEADEREKKERGRWEAETEQRVAAARRGAQAEAEALLAAACTRLEREAEQRIAAELARRVSENAPVVQTAVMDQPGHETLEKLAQEQDKNRQLNTELLAAADQNQELAAALAAMTQRCENAEREAAEGPGFDQGVIQNLRSEIAGLRRSMANQAGELERARIELAQARPAQIQREVENQWTGPLRPVRAEDDEAEDEEKSNGLIRDCLLVAGIIIPLVLFYPWIALYLPQGVRDGVSVATGGLLSVEITPPVIPQKPLPPPPPPKPKRPAAIASRILNVRAEPALKGAVILSLPKNAAVEILEKQGNWTQIEIPAESTGKPEQGWVWSAYLQSKDN